MGITNDESYIIYNIIKDKEIRDGSTREIVSMYQCWSLFDNGQPPYLTSDSSQYIGRYLFLFKSLLLTTTNFKNGV